MVARLCAVSDAKHGLLGGVGKVVCVGSAFPRDSGAHFIPGEDDATYQLLSLASSHAFDALRSSCVHFSGQSVYRMEDTNSIGLH